MRWKALGRLAVSGVLLALLFRSVGLADVGAELRAARPAPLLGAIGLYCLAGTWVRALRWRALIAGLGQRISVARTIQLFLLGTLFSQVLPTGLGGDVVRAIALGRQGLGSARALGTVVVDRALGVLPLLALGLLAVVVAPGHVGPAVAGALVVVGCLGLAGMVVLFHAHRAVPWLSGLPLAGWLLRRPSAGRFAGSFAAYDRRALATATAWSLVFIGLLVGANALLGRAVGIDEATLRDWSVVVPLASLSLLLPSVGGWGVREWTYVGLLGLLDPPVGPHTATAVSLLFGALNLLLAAAGGAVVLLGGPAPGDVVGLAGDGAPDA